MKTRRLLVVLLLATLLPGLGACNLTESERTLVRDLEERLDRWNQHRPQSYTFELEQRCDCPDEVELPTTIHVDGVEVVWARDSATDSELASGDPRVRTIDDIFARLIDHARRDGSGVSIEFNVEYHYPLEAHAWVSAGAVEDFGYRVRWFEPAD